MLIIPTKEQCKSHGNNYDSSCRSCTSLEKILRHIINRIIYKKTTGQTPMVN